MSNTACPTHPPRSHPPANELAADTLFGAQPGKYITFVLGDESYGIPALKVREIIRRIPVTAVPQMPAYIRGVINLRGKIIPIVDLRSRFGLPPAQDSGRACIVVVQIEAAGAAKLLLGVIVDGVEEVANITSGDIEPTPDFGSRIDTHFISGMAKIKGDVKTLLDIDRLLAPATIESLPQIHLPTAAKSA